MNKGVMKTNKRRLIVFIVAICLTAICSSLATAMLLYFADSEGIEPIPHTMIASETSPDQTRNAVLFFAHTWDAWDLLGTGERFYLGIQYQETTYLVTRDLTEGFGTYEGGVLDIQWLDRDRILVTRIVADQQDDIVFNLETHTWKPHVSSSTH